MVSLFHAPCPSCGAEIEIHSATAVTEVCGYCHSMLILEGQALTESGRHSAVLRDFSPLQVGTSGSWKGQLFTLIGRLQVQYDGGGWNEWHALMADGSSAWLSESSDRFVFTRLETQAQIGNIPKYADMKIGRTFFAYGPKKYAAADVREVYRGRFAAEGELPYLVPEQETARVVDCRSGDVFMTLDYTQDENKPEVFIGEGVALNALRLQNTRDLQQIKDSAGKLKGSAQQSKCPNCGGPVRWVTGVATHVVCEYCQSQIEFNEDQVRVVATNDMRVAQDEALTLKIGSKARIMAVDWWVIGAMKQSEVRGDEASQTAFSYNMPKVLVPAGEPWFEYLLYSPKDGFLWLTELAGGRWAIAKTLDVWPQLQQPLRPVDGNQRLVPELYDYGGQVQYAAGAFYWQVGPKDTTYYVDFGREKQKLSTALTREEQSWSAISEIPAQAVAAWFKQAQIVSKPMDVAAADQLARQALRLEASHFNGNMADKLRTKAEQNGGGRAASPMIWLLIYGVLNFPAMLMGLVGDGFFGVVIISFIVYWLLNLPFNNAK